MNDLCGNSTTEVVTVATSTPIERQKAEVKFEDKKVSCNESQAGSPTNTIILQSSLDSLPKLKLDTFDGDPIWWSDCISMFRSIIDEANISCNAKMQHLQNAGTGRAKEAMEGYGYSGELYPEALKKLESRFGKSHVLVKAHLNRLWKWSKLSDERLHEVRRFLDVVLTSVKAFKCLGYSEDLNSANNLNMVVDKLSSLCVKWKEYKRYKRLNKANLLYFEKWIEAQADIHDDFWTQTNKPLTNPSDVKSKGRHHNAAAVYSAVTPPTGERHSLREQQHFKTSGQSSVPCFMGATQLPQV